MGSEDAESEFDDEEQHTSTRRESEDLGQEAGIEGPETFFSGDEDEGRESPVVLRSLSGDLYELDGRAFIREDQCEHCESGQTLIEFWTRDFTTSTAEFGGHRHHSATESLLNERGKELTRSVESGTNETSDRTGDEVVEELTRL